MIVVSSEPFDAGLLLTRFKERAGEGAIVSFTGVVRGSEGAELLTLQHYPGFTERELEKLVADIKGRFGLTATMLYHRHGPMRPGEEIMFAATAAPHRRAALDGLAALMDRLKTDAPFWKSERRSGKDIWLEPPAAQLEQPMNDARRVSIAILTVSDTRDDETDTSGAYLAEAIERAGHRLADRRIVPDDRQAIQDAVLAWTEGGEVDVAITTGGTGLTGRDVTPEALQPLFDKVIDGFPAVWHAISFQSIGLSTMQSRACAGLVGTMFVFCLPGSNSAVRDGWEKVIEPQLRETTRPCNFVEIMPRLAER